MTAAEVAAHIAAGRNFPGVERRALPGGLVALYVLRRAEDGTSPRQPRRLVDHGNPRTARDDTSPPRGEHLAPVARSA